ncbi:polymorphic toxin type 44 domain-containing protein [Streptococcus oralis]|uniref:polymorphic toxin type 44 domain-containing protein n=1 Tax=Streptococcus oralis TaxID=1303 RepID=UPI001156B227|nr:polymorphic toxin type 44 domain-containing protein [Streptococcus oralis]
MGVKYSAQESQELIQAMTNNLQVANEVTDRLSSGCDHLISSLDSGELTGAAYTAGKGLFTEIIIPSIKKLQAAIDDIQLELTSYKNADAQVSGYGDLDLDQLKELKKLREEQLAIVETQIQARENWLNQIKDLFSLNWGKAFSEKTILYNTKSQIESGIQDLEDKIEKLEFFVSQVSQYFSDSLEVLGLAIQGATQLSKIIVDSDGNYYADGVDMSWVQKMKDVKIESAKYDSSKKTKDLHKEYQSILDKLEKGKELSDKEFETLESYARRYPKVQLPEIVTNKLTTEAANRANLEKLQEKVEKIKKSDKTSTEKANLIVKAYEDYLFYNNRAAFDEYWKKRKAMDDDWTSKDPNMIKKKEKIEKEFNDSLSNSRINVKEIAQQLGDDVLDVKKMEDEKRSELIQKGREFWKSPGDNGVTDFSTPIGTKLGDNATFIDLVNTNQPLDLKNRVYRDDYPFSVWGRQWEEGMKSDYMGNYLFGYVGKGYLESSDDYLKYGAGKAQQFSDYLKFDKYFVVGADIKYDLSLLQGQYGDNFGDAAAIQDGADAYKGGNN